MSAAVAGDIWGIFWAANYKPHCFQYATVPSNWCCQIILSWGAGPAPPFPSRR